MFKSLNLSVYKSPVCILRSIYLKHFLCINVHNTGAANFIGAKYKASIYHISIYIILYIRYVLYKVQLSYR